MQLQKIVGFRPPSDYLSERNLIYASPIANNFKDRDRRNVDQEQPPASLICWRSCNDDPDCIAYVHLLDTDECYGYSYFERNARYLPMTDELPLVADSEAMFYEKTCLRGMCFSWAWLTTLVKQHLTQILPPHSHTLFFIAVPDACKGRLWALTKIPGNSLVYHGRKTISTLVTRRECAERCFFETQFPCLSASFAPSYRNNRER